MVLSFLRCLKSGIGLTGIWMLLLSGCDMLQQEETQTIRNRPLPMRRSADDEDQELVAVAPEPESPVEHRPMTDPEPLVLSEPIVLPAALPGILSECVVDGVAFRATECYRTARGFRLTIYCGSNERNVTIGLRSDINRVSGLPSGESAALIPLRGPYSATRCELPRGQVAWFQLNAPALPLTDTDLSTVSIQFNSESSIRGRIEFAGLPISEQAPILPAEELALNPDRLERLCASGQQCDAYWRLNQYVGDTKLCFEAFDPETRTIRGAFRDAMRDYLVKEFEGSLAEDGMSLTLKTIRNSGWGGRGTSGISNENLYLRGQETQLTLFLIRGDLLGITPERIAFCVEMPW